MLTNDTTHTWTDSEGDAWSFTQDERTENWTATGIGHKGKAYAVSLRAMKEGIEAGIAWDVHGQRTSADC